MLWEATWGVNGGDFAREIFDESGDVYVTGTGIDFVDQYSTIKLAGADGSLIWQEYDQGGIDDSASGIALDRTGGLYITGTVDPDGNASNANNQIYTVKRDSATGEFLWDFIYGDTCVGCSDGASDVAVDADGTVYVTGATSSPPYSHDAIVFVLDPATGVEIDRGVVPSEPDFHRDFAAALFSGRGDLRAAGENNNLNTGETDITVTRYPTPARRPLRSLGVESGSGEHLRNGRGRERNARCDAVPDLRPDRARDTAGAAARSRDRARSAPARGDGGRGCGWERDTHTFNPSGRGRQRPLVASCRGRAHHGTDDGAGVLGELNRCAECRARPSSAFSQRPSCVGTGKKFRGKGGLRRRSRCGPAPIS